MPPFAAGAALALGALSYLTRASDPAVVGWAERAGLGGVATIARGWRLAVHGAFTLPSWLSGSVADVAYAFALGALFADARPGLVLLALAAALAHEIAQGVHLVAGTFDPRDLVVLVVSFVLALSLFRPQRLLRRRISS